MIINKISNVSGKKEPKVFVLTPWAWRNHFVPIYNYLLLNQNYSNYTVNIGIEKFNMDHESWINDFDESFNVVQLDDSDLVPIGHKLNIVTQKYLTSDYDYVVVVSSDDYYGPNYIKNSIEYIEANGYEAMNMKVAKFLALPNGTDMDFRTSYTNTSTSWGAMFVYNYNLAKRFGWHSKLKVTEDAYLWKHWKENNVKLTSTNAHSKDWLGIIHGNNINTHYWKYYFKWKIWDDDSLLEYVNNDQFVYMYYKNLYKLIIPTP